MKKRVCVARVVSLVAWNALMSAACLGPLPEGSTGGMEVCVSAFPAAAGSLRISVKPLGGGDGVSRTTSIEGVEACEVFSTLSPGDYDVLVTALVDGLPVGAQARETHAVRADRLSEVSIAMQDGELPPSSVLCSIDADCSHLEDGCNVYHCEDGACGRFLRPARDGVTDSCNGQDDDCDGATDEDFEPATESCGRGACARTVQTACIDGLVVSECEAGTPAAADLTCDGVDDDCDGATDEEYLDVAAATPPMCGRGVCMAEGARRCEGGVVVEVCVPAQGAPDDSACDGLDNDCDGDTDELALCPSGFSCREGSCVLDDLEILPPSSFSDEVIIDDLNWENIACDPTQDHGSARVACATAYLHIGARGSRCTAWLAGPDLLVTNNHCVRSADDAVGAYAVFGVEEGAAQTAFDWYACETLLATDAVLDVSLLRCSAKGGVTPGDAYQTWLDIDLRQRAPLYETVYLTHQNCERDPENDVLCAAGTLPTRKLSAGPIVDPAGAGALASPHIAHIADTLPGSSGAPILDAARHVVVGIHWAGFTRDNPRFNVGTAASSFCDNDEICELLATQPPPPFPTDACDRQVETPTPAVACHTWTCTEARGWFWRSDTNLDGTSCDDGNRCTTGESCAGGVCGGGDDTDCSDGNPCTLDLCYAATGCDNPNDDTLVPEDGIPCTRDTCSNGVAANTPVNAECDDGNACTSDSCVPGDGCSHQNVEGQPDDGVDCTVDGCSAGVEEHTPDNAACETETQGNRCLVPICDRQAGCRFVQLPDGSSCDGDGNVCNGTCQCFDGVEQLVDELVCDDGNPCTDDSCDASGGCQFVMNVETVPDDGFACTVDSCSAFGDPVHTPQHSACETESACEVGYCDPTSGAPLTGCAVVPYPDGATCSDGNPCNGIETCEAGECTAGVDLACDDENGCTADMCVAEVGVGCTHVPIEGEPDSDGVNCTADACAGGRTVHSPDDRECLDPGPCGAAFCDPELGCRTIFLPDGTSCADIDPCDGAEVCSEGECVAPEAGGLDCDDGNPCTLDTCGPAGCSNTPDPSPDPLSLSDGVDCTLDSCRGGVLRHEANNDACDSGPCVTAYCDPLADCREVPLPAGTSCSNELFCDGVEVCDQNGECQPGETVECDGACLTGICDEDVDACERIAGLCLASGGFVSLESSPVPRGGSYQVVGGRFRAIADHQDEPMSSSSYRVFGGFSSLSAD